MHTYFILDFQFCNKIELFIKFFHYTMNYLSSLFSTKTNDTDLGIILESNGVITESTSSYKSTQSKTKTTSLLNNNSINTTSINNNTYSPPTRYYTLPKKVESPFSPFKIWGQKT